MAEYDVVLSLISSDAVFCGFDVNGFPIDDITRLVCCVDGKTCKDFVNCLRFKDSGGSIVLVWRCPRFKTVVCHG